MVNVLFSLSVSFLYICFHTVHAVVYIILFHSLLQSCVLDLMIQLCRSCGSSLSQPVRLSLPTLNLCHFDLHQTWFTTATHVYAQAETKG